MHGRNPNLTHVPRAFHRQMHVWSAVCLLLIVGVVFAQQPAPRYSPPRTSPVKSRPNSSVRSQRTAMRLDQHAAPSNASVATRWQPAPAGAEPNAAAVEPMPPPNQAEVPNEPVGEDLPETPQTFGVPLQEPNFERMQFRSSDGTISLVAQNAPLGDIIRLISQTQGLNVVSADPLSQPVSVTLERVDLNDALDAILSISGYTFSINKRIILISSLNTATSISPQAQGLRLEVFPLDYVMAVDVNLAIQSMISPIGRSFTIASNAQENRRGREIVAVYDMPQYLDAIRQYVAQLDIPPRQVLIEAHILQVELDDQNRNGVNFDQLFNKNGNLLVEMHTSGFAAPTPTQAFTFRFSDGNLTSFIEILRTTTDAKTLASPRLTVLNGQQSRIQVGEQLGFRVTTTTETSTTESVDFLDVGVVLEVTPRISRDGRVMISVRPEVSSGQVNPSTGLPEEQTTELETDILLNDNEGIIIGGLIQETDNDLQSKLPFLGDLYVVGRLFQRKQTAKTRREIIIALIPRVIPYEPNYDLVAREQYARVDTRLLQGALQEVDRPWEPRLEDAIENPRPLPSVRGLLPFGRCRSCNGACLDDYCATCDAAASLPPDAAVRVETKPPVVRPRVPPNHTTPIEPLPPADEVLPVEVLEDSDAPQEDNLPPEPPLVPLAKAMHRLPRVLPPPPTARITGLTAKPAAPRIASPPSRTVIR